MMFTHLDLFSGIGGFALAARWAGIGTVGFSEIEPYACRVLAKNFPGVVNHGDIKGVGRETIKESPWLITGGFPCQPVSLAGQRRGANDDRWLWPELHRVIAELRPCWVLGENTPGLISMGLDGAIADLEAEDYEVGVFTIPACAVSAPHERQRVWIVAHAERAQRRPRKSGGYVADGRAAQRKETASGVGASDTNGRARVMAHAAVESKRKSANQNNAVAGGRDPRPEPGGRDWWSAEPGVGRVAVRVSNGVDRRRGLGNAIVPENAYRIMLAMLEVETKPGPNA